MGSVHAFGDEALEGTSASRRLAGILAQERPDGIVVSALRGVHAALIAEAERAVEGRQDVERLRRACLDPDGAAVLASDAVAEGWFAELLDVLRAVTLVGELSAERRVRVTSFGTRFAARAVVAWLRAHGVEARERTMQECHREPWEGIAVVPADGAPADVPAERADGIAVDIAARRGARRVVLWKDLEPLSAVDARWAPDPSTVEVVHPEEAHALALLGFRYVQEHVPCPPPAGVALEVRTRSGAVLHVSEDLPASRGALLVRLADAWIADERVAVPAAFLRVETPARALVLGRSPAPGVGERPVEVLAVVATPRREAAARVHAWLRTAEEGRGVTTVLEPALLAAILLVVERGAGERVGRALARALGNG